MAELPINYGDTGKVARDKINDSFEALETTVAGYRPHIESGIRWIGNTNTGVKAEGDSIVMKAEDGYIWYKSESNSWTKIIAIADLKGDQGNPGADGNGIASITTTKIGKTTTVTITETDGNVDTFSILDGADGVGGDGDVKGPNSSTNGHMAVFDGATGKIIRDGGSIPTGFEPGAGTAGQILRKTNSGYEWDDESGGGGSGDVTGPASSVDGHLAVFDGATGKLLKDGGEIPENTKIFGFPNVNSDISSIITATASNKNVILSESLSMTEVRFYRVTAKKSGSNRIVATSYKQSSGQYIVKTINYNSSKIVTSITETVKSFFDSSTVLTKTNTTAFTPTGDYQPATKKYVDDKQSTITVTLAAASWSANEITVSATGVTASNTVIVSPTPSDYSDYTDAEIYCSSQASDSLTFVCDTEPSNDIDVNVVILN